jgi:hypothetical protein
MYEGDASEKEHSEGVIYPESRRETVKRPWCFSPSSANRDRILSKLCQHNALLQGFRATDRLTSSHIGYNTRGMMTYSRINPEV